MATSGSPLILLASARKDGDTATFVRNVFQETPHQVIDLLDVSVAPYCYDQDYPAQDGFLNIIAQLLPHQVIVFATPVYWYAMSGLLKNFLDRFTDLVTTHKDLVRNLAGKTVFLLAVGVDAELPDGFEVPFKLTAKYLHLVYGSSLYASTEEVETSIFHVGQHQQFLREIADAQKEIS